MKVKLQTEENLESIEKEEMRLKKKATILMIVCISVVLLIGLDILLVTKANVGPFLAIRTKVYKDGGSKEYYGLFYKVIKYNQEIGRKDTQLGSWSMKYNITPTTMTSGDIALAFRNTPVKTYKRLYQQFLRITGTISAIDKKTNTIMLTYTDKEGGAYTLDIVCQMASGKGKKIKEVTSLSNFEKGNNVTVIGLLVDYTPKSGNTAAFVTMENCFMEK